MRINNKTALQVALGLMLCVFCGCTSGSLISIPSNSYKYTVVYRPLGPRQTIEIDVRPGVPFAVKTEDEAGNHYQVSGTLWQKTQEIFQLKPSTIEMRFADGVGRYSWSTPEPRDIKLGVGQSDMAVEGGGVVDLIGITLAREAQ